MLFCCYGDYFLKMLFGSCVILCNSYSMLWVMTKSTITPYILRGPKTKPGVMPLGTPARLSVPSEALTWWAIYPCSCLVIQSVFLQLLHKFHEILSELNSWRKLALSCPCSVWDYVLWKQNLHWIFLHFPIELFTLSTNTWLPTSVLPRWSEPQGCPGSYSQLVPAHSQLWPPLCNLQSAILTGRLSQPTGNIYPMAINIYNIYQGWRKLVVKHLQADQTVLDFKKNPNTWGTWGGLRTSLRMLSTHRWKWRSKAQGIENSRAAHVGKISLLISLLCWTGWDL